MKGVWQLKYCKCGCGRSTKRYRDYVNNHDKRKSNVSWLEEDRGFETPCWIWQLGKNSHGYGAINRKGRTRQAHLVLYEDKNGPVTFGVQLDHKCRNRDCVNLDHLEPVSCAVNIRRGKAAKLTEGQVIAIRNQYDCGDISQMSISKIYGVSRTAIQHIVNGSTWKSIGSLNGMGV